jgi:hypothetical protein
MTGIVEINRYVKNLLHVQRGIVPRSERLNHDHPRFSVAVVGTIEVDVFPTSLRF